MKKLSICILICMVASVVFGAVYARIFYGEFGLIIDNPSSGVVRVSDLGEDLKGTFTSNTMTLTSDTGVNSITTAIPVTFSGGTTLSGTNTISGAANVSGAANFSAAVTSKYGTNFAVDSNGNDSYKITLSPAPSAYTAGMTIIFDANTANTGACTINVNGLGSKALKSLHDRDPDDNYIEAGSIVMAVYDGTNFQIISPDANP